MEDIEKKEPKVLQMADRRKQIEDLYSSDVGVRTFLRNNNAAAGGSFFTLDNLIAVMNQVGSASLSYDNVIRLSEYAYATEPSYSSIIDYLANTYLWRYYYVPVLIKEKANATDYEEIYRLMTDIVDGLSIEITFPMVLTKLFKEGVVYLYTTKNTASKTISTITLNPKFCKPVMISQYGTGIYQFDAKYFDSLGARDEKLEELLNLFPDELVKCYNEYKAGGPQFYTLDGRFSTYISVNEYGFPNRLSILKSILDYQKYRANEVERNSAQLDRIVTHKIPSFEGSLLFELPEIKALHATMARGLSTNTRTRLLTTFGDVEIHPLQENSSVQNKTLETANKVIYDTAGLNSSLFNGTTQDALTYSQIRDASMVWKYIQQLVNFYNLTINNLFNFKGYQIELTMLPITHYNMKDSMEIYRRNAEYGVGKLELIVSSGTKQRHINHKHELESFLKLDEILTPLKSSHTTSGSKEVEDRGEDSQSQIEEEDDIDNEDEN